MLLLKSENNTKIVIADDDDKISLDTFFRYFHLPDHKLMKSLYENSMLDCAVLKQEKFKICV